MAGSRTVPDVAMVIGRDGSALASRRRVILRRKGSDPEGEERETVGDEVERVKVRSAWRDERGEGLALSRTIMVVVFVGSAVDAVPLCDLVGCRR